MRWIQGGPLPTEGLVEPIFVHVDVAVSRGGLLPNIRDGLLPDPPH